MMADVIPMRQVNDRSLTVHGGVFQALVRALGPRWVVALTRYDSRGISAEIETGGKRYALTLVEIGEGG